MADPSRNSPLPISVALVVSSDELSCVPASSAQDDNDSDTHHVCLT